DVESFWRTRQIYHNYNQIDDFLSLPYVAPVDLALDDFDVFEWHDVRLEVLPAPGHTPGAIALVGELSGQRLAFVGDMIEAPGRVPQIHSLQYGYSDAGGAELLISSLHYLMKQRPAVLYPGHGPTIERPAESCETLTVRLKAFCQEMYQDIGFQSEPHFLRIGEHLLQSAESGCSWHVVLSDDGHALLIDVGYSPTVLASACRFGYHTRFLPHTVDALLGEQGVKQIDAVIVTHYHDDHVIGIPYLQKRYGTPAWCLDRIAPILREPMRFNMPCLMPRTIRVDRTIADREVFEWRGVDFQMHDLPGQTDLHSGVSFDIDSKRYLAMGDSAHWREGKLAHGNIIFANRVNGRNHLKVAERMLEIEPDVLLHGHHRRKVDGIGRADTPVTREDLLDYRDSAERLNIAIADLATDEPDRRCRADWVRLDPYRLFVSVGSQTAVALIAENLHDQPIHLELRFILPDGISVDHPEVCCALAPGQTHTSNHCLRLESITGSSPTIICVDVVLNDRPLGWIGHTQVWHDGIPR
ncbi:MAG: MBL fold metallo-hydrolase, partial [Lentisphaeria bacterium]|nr:MBL fold metallo-hydrolase [Lentisphaeria bacterium]